MEKKEYYVTLDDGTKVPVTIKVYSEYYRSEWREHKQEQRDRKRMLSIDYEYSSGSDGGSITLMNYRVDPNPTPEEVILNKEELFILLQAMEILAEDYRNIIENLFIEGKTECEYAEETGMARTTINYKRKKALEKMKKYMQKKL